MQENCPSGSEGGGAKPIASPYPYTFIRPRSGLIFAHIVNENV